jgi:hypothetical protein
MDQLYFACNWIVNADEFSNVWRLIETAKVMGCSLKDSRFEFGLETKEGYSFYRFVIEVPSTTILQQYVKQVAIPESPFAAKYPIINQNPKPTHFSDWYPVSQQYFDQISIFVVDGETKDVGDLQQINSMMWTDVAAFYSRRNKELGELLATRTAEYYVCDWVIPGSQPDGWLRIFIDPFYQYKMRTSGSRQNEEGFFIQRMIVRVFDIEELDNFVHKKGRQAGLTQWKKIAETEFYEALPITDNIQMIALPGLVTEVENLETIFNRMGQANEKLREQSGR